MTGCSSGAQGGKARTYLHAREGAGGALDRALSGSGTLLAIAGALPFSGADRPWLVCSCVDYHSSLYGAGWFQSGLDWNPDGCKTGLDRSQSVRTALKRARRL